MAREMQHRRYRLSFSTGGTSLASAAASMHAPVLPPISRLASNLSSSKLPSLSSLFLFLHLLSYQAVQWYLPAKPCTLLPQPIAQSMCKPSTSSLAEPVTWKPTVQCRPTQPSLGTLLASPPFPPPPPHFVLTTPNLINPILILS
jgi:hypothetical protein